MFNFFKRKKEKSDQPMTSEEASAILERGVDILSRWNKQVLKTTTHADLQSSNNIAITNSSYYERIIGIFKSDGAFKGETKNLLLDKDILGIAQKYVLHLLNESGPIRRWGSDPEDYYFQIAAHCYCAGLCVASWWFNQGDEFSPNTAFAALKSEDSILIANTVVPIKDTFNLEMMEDIRFNQFLGFIKEAWNGKIDNKNESIIAGLVAFFMAGSTEDLTRYSTAPEYEYEEDNYELDDEDDNYELDDEDDYSDEENLNVNYDVSNFRGNLVKQLYEIGIKADYVRDINPLFPHLYMEQDSVVSQMISAINKVEPDASPDTIIAWCCFAGIGAVVHDRKNTEEVHKKGVFNILTRERGVFAMDEYVLDLIGAPLQTQEGKNITIHIMGLARLCLDRLATVQKNVQDTSSLFIDACQVMYLYGISLESKRLGIKPFSINMTLKR
jgi:hypothetical protein